MRLVTSIFVLLTLAAIVGSPASAAPIDLSTSDPGLSGTVTTDLWTDLTASANPGYGGFPGTTAWPAPIASQSGSTTAGGAGLTKLSNGAGGGPYPASGSIYFGGFSSDVNYNGGTLAVQDSTPVADVSNVVFQVQIGEAWTYDFLDHILPSLTVTTTSGDVTIAGADAAYSGLVEQFDNGTVTMPTGEETVYINTWMVQWDLSGITDTISDLSVEFTGVQHAQLYQLRLDQSDSFTLIPEPASLSLVVIGAAFCLARRRAA